MSDPGAEVIRKYGLLHSKGHEDQDIALRTTIVIDEQGREIYRKVSSSVPDVRTADEKARVSNLVKAEPGVKDFTNGLEIKPRK